ncbi:GTP cyclohydrolase II [uncultured Litoreibacter sp.]|uniref:GTP cyclohydrolase II n=1 Tax=uncultured Litoreibacter sp. TaxID=1392394 RepID=UPI0026036B9B|nr:GTP cyclohydrolase II [uncultured Litoreibacter sp.]
MTLAPDTIELAARARADLRMGVPVIIGSSLVLAAETLGETRLEALQTADMELVLAITDWRAKTLKATAYDTDVARIVVPKDASVNWIGSIANPSDDLNAPMKGPLRTIRDGSAETARLAIQLAKDAQLLPAVVLGDLEAPHDYARQHYLTILGVEALARVSNVSSPQFPLVNARLPLEVNEAGRLHVFRPEDGGEEHYAIEIGQPSRSEPLLTRLHSACFTGDVLGSLKCDCGPQLRGALTQMGAAGEGVLLYLNQEGRGIGLANKMRAYSLQDQGFDTVEANHRLGFEDDERDFRIGASILKSMGFTQIRLLTNNPAKIAMLEANGLEVTERVPLKVGETRFNTNYLATKATKSGHLL